MSVNGALSQYTWKPPTLVLVRSLVAHFLHHHRSEAADHSASPNTPQPVQCGAACPSGLLKAASPPAAGRHRAALQPRAGAWPPREPSAGGPGS